MWKVINLKTSLFLVFGVLLFLWGCKAEPPSFTGEEISSTAKQSFDENDRAENDPVSYVVVFICGEVECAGVYSLAEGSRLEDAVTAAGGFTAIADREYLNLAAFLTDGQKIEVPSLTQTALWKEQESSTEEGLVNINTADVKTLCTLPGIGESRAKQIIAYREKNGDYADIEDLMKVSGIKQNTWDNIRDRITVGR